VRILRRGFVRRRADDPAQIEKMTATMPPRAGRRGRASARRRARCAGPRRLSIVDLSAAGHQPIEQ
jgi:asparagine synthetase B (glutamine-hydrolysing)